MSSQNYVVKAPLVVATQADGSHLYLYHGAPVPEDLPSDEVKRLKDEKFIGTPDDAKKAAKKSSSSSDAYDPAKGAPAKNGKLEDWQAFAKSKGATDQDLADVSRDDLVAKYGESA